MTEKTFWRTVRRNGTTELIPADRRTAQIANDYREGETRGGKLTKPRNPRFNSLMHVIGSMAAQNLDAFEGMGGHDVLKRLQMEANVECDEMMAVLDGVRVLVRLPKSLSFDTMSEDEFKRVSRAICHRLTDYWDGTTVEEILQMAQEHERSAA